MPWKRSELAAGLIVLPLLLAVAWPAFAQAAPWGKPCIQWTPEDAAKVLEDSPWTRRIGVPAVWLRMTAEAVEAGPVAPVGKMPPDFPHSELRDGDPIATFLLRWESSRAAACARELLPERKKQLIRGTIAQEPAAGEIVLHLVRDNWVPFVRVLDAVRLLETTYLTLRSSGRRVYPARIEILRDSEGHAQGLTFYFRRFDRDGRPWLGANEDRVDFHCRFGAVASLHTHFRLRAMVFDGRPDF